MLTNHKGGKKKLCFRIPKCKGTQETKPMCMKLSPGVLYHVRMLHPVIDGIGVQRCEWCRGSCECNNYLVMITAAFSNSTGHSI